MSMQNIREFYKVPAKRGGRIAYTGAGKNVLGTIIRSEGPNLIIRLDGSMRPGKFHPTWELKYL